MSDYNVARKACQNALKRLSAVKPDSFEIYFERKRATQIESKDYQVDSLSQSEDVGLAVRMIRNRRLGFSFTTSLEPAAIERAVDWASEVTSAMPQDPYVSFYQFKNQNYSELKQFDSQGISSPIQEKVQIAQEIEKECRSFDRKITGVRSASLSETLWEVYMVDSEGSELKHQATGYSASVTCKAEHEGDSQMGGDFTFSPYLKSLDTQSVAHNGARWALELLGAQAAPTLQCPAVLRNNVVAELIDFLSSSFSAEEIDKGRSMLAGQLGQSICSKNITLIHDGLLPEGMGSTPFDAEGVPAERSFLIDKGKLNQILYDCYFAKKNGVKPNGCATRGIKSPPSIGHTNLWIEPGPRSFESMIQNIDRGVLITDLMGLHTANPVTGDFSLGASGILIEKGKLARPVRGFAVAGNILGLFKKIAEVGQDLRYFGSIGAPSLLVGEISIGGA